MLSLLRPPLSSHIVLSTCIAAGRDGLRLSLISSVYRYVYNIYKHTPTADNSSLLLFSPPPAKETHFFQGLKMPRIKSNEAPGAIYSRSPEGSSYPCHNKYFTVNTAVKLSFGKDKKQALELRLCVFYAAGQAHVTRGLKQPLTS